MTDDVAAMQTAALRIRTVEERLRIAQSLRDFAWALKRATIARRHPHLTDGELAHQVRLAFGS